ncbi:MAG: SDR family oxidoreductase [Deltaproteobacteria bacterium]|nr:SDR family oxidoreductase [Deltaproteobacteria bacterium]
MRALVTGGAGFIGSHIAERLVRTGHAVRVLDDLSAGKRANLAAVAGDVELVVADVRDAARVDELARDCDVIFHEAAIVSVPYSVEHPIQTNGVNVIGTLNVLEAARKQGVRRVVFACSAAVYGEDPAQPKTESMLPSPVSPYGVEKLASEHYLAAWSRLFGLETVSLRYFNVFGPRQDPSSPYSGVISIFVSRFLAGQPVTIFGDGEQYRDFVYVDNVVDANLAAATRDGISGRAFNVGCGRRTTLNQLVAILGHITGRAVLPRHEAPRAGDIRESLADISRARRELAYEPRIDVDEGLARLVEDVRRG